MFRGRGLNAPQGAEEVGKGRSASVCVCVCARVHVCVCVSWGGVGWGGSGWGGTKQAPLKGTSRNVKMASKMEELIKKIRKDGDTIGGVITCIVKNVPNPRYVF